MSSESERDVENGRTKTTILFKKGGGYKPESNAS